MATGVNSKALQYGAEDILSTNIKIKLWAPYVKISEYDLASIVNFKTDINGCIPYKAEAFSSE